jgi:hypothetical protein
MNDSTSTEFRMETAQRLIDQSVRDMYTRYTSDLSLEETRNLLQLFIQHSTTPTIYSVMDQTEPIVTSLPVQRPEGAEELLQHVFSSDEDQEPILAYLQSDHTIITSGSSNPNAVTFPDTEPDKL